MINAIQDEFPGYGYRRVTRELAARGAHINHCFDCDSKMDRHRKRQLGNSNCYVYGPLSDYNYWINH